MTQNEKDREWLDYVDEEIRKKRTIDRGFFYFSKYGNWQTDYSQSGRMRMLCISLTLRKTECETNLQKKDTQTHWLPLSADDLTHVRGVKGIWIPVEGANKE